MNGSALTECEMYKTQRQTVHFFYTSSSHYWAWMREEEEKAKKGSLWIWSESISFEIKASLASVSTKQTN